MRQCKTKSHKSNIYVLCKQPGISGILQLDFVGEKLISGILAYGTFEINHASHGYFKRQQCFYELCTMEFFLK